VLNFLEGGKYISIW